MLDIQNLMAQAAKMQNEMGRIEEELAQKTVSADAGGGMVTAVVTCNYRVKSLKISKEIATSEDVDMLEDLVVAAINKAMELAKETSEAEMGKVSSMMPNIPGLGF